MIAFEKLDNSVALIGIIPKADEMLQKGWRRRGYETIDIQRKIPWKLKNDELRSHNFRIQCLEMLDILLRAYSLSDDMKYLKKSIPIALDWVKNNSDPTDEDISPFAWYDMAVGLRVFRLAYLFDAADQIGLLDDGARQILWNSLEQHAVYLADDANISFHSNHGYYQVAGQLAMGRRFAAKSPAMAQAYQQGGERLRHMLVQQFTSDGVHREHSPDYHRMVYDTLKALIDSGLVEDVETIAFARRIEEALAWFVFPNQHIVNFGDTEDRSMARCAKEAELKWVTPEMRFWASGGVVSDPPKETSRAFAEGGYWIARQPCGDPRVSQNYSYLALNAAFHSRTHKHADDLSFVWFDRGANILVDAGRYGYIGKTEVGSELWLDGHWYADTRRIYCESTRAHNTLEFDNLNFPRKGVKPYGSALCRWGHDASGMQYVESECRQFNSIRHMRMLYFMPNQWVLVLDWFHDNNGASHNVKQWFHIGHELQLLMDNNQYVVPVPTSKQFLRVASLLCSPIPSRLYIGEEEPMRQGWWSPIERDILPNYAFNFELENVSTGTFATLFCFSDKLQADAVWSKVNVSGRKGQLRWTDDRGINEVRFERPVEGNLSITYGVRA